MIEKVQNNDSDGSIPAFATAFYNDVKRGENGGVMNDWSLKHLGSKWTTLYDVKGEGEFSIESAWYPPKEFFIVHIIRLILSFNEILNLVIFLFVISIEFLSFRDKKKGITEPLEPATFPYLTIENFLLPKK